MHAKARMMRIFCILLALMSIGTAFPASPLNPDASPETPTPPVAEKFLTGRDPSLQTPTSPVTEQSFMVRGTSPPTPSPTSSSARDLTEIFTLGPTNTVMIAGSSSQVDFPSQTIALYPSVTVDLEATETIMYSDGLTYFIKSTTTNWPSITTVIPSPPLPSPLR